MVSHKQQIKREKVKDSTGKFNHSKVEAIPLSALLKDTTSELAGLSSHLV